MMVRLLGVMVVLVPLAACVPGIIGDEVDPLTPRGPSRPPTRADAGTSGPGADRVEPVEDCTPATRTLGETPLRRLSSEQYANALTALFGTAVAPQLLARSSFPDTDVSSGFVNDADANTVSTGDSNAIEDNAEALANHLLANAGALMPGILDCAALGGASDAQIDGCMDGFIERFGARAYRRPLDAGERSRVRALYDLVRTTQPARNAWATVMQFFFQAPPFLYRVERGVGEVPGSPDLIALTDYEMASRLSFFFLNTIPDETLLAKAAAGELHTPGQVAIEARRLAADPRVMETMGVFHRDWLRLYHLVDAPKAMPELSADTRASLLTETTELLRAVLERGDGTLRTLLSTPYIPVNADTAPLYGLDTAGRTRELWADAEIRDRRGLLTSASFMATHARDTSTHVIERGAFFRREVLCGSLPQVPGNIDLNGPLEATASLPTARQRLAPLLERNDCKGCHTSINPVGYAFENYDHVGRWRDQENGVTIDASGELTNAGDANVTFDGPHRLVEALAGSQTVADCYATQWFRFAVGKREAPEDTCAVRQVREAFVTANGSIQELLVQVTLSDAFMYRRKQEN